MRRLSVSAGLAGLPALVMLGQAAAFWQVIVLTTVVWFCGGIGLALVSILTSLYADGSTRGRSFGQMFLARPLAGVVGGVICGQLTPLIGMLSDRLGRRRLLVASYALAAGGVLLLSTATELWQFWMATALLFAATTANGSVAAALATDLLPRNALRRGMSWLNSMTWVAGIIGFAVRAIWPIRSALPQRV